MSGISGTSAEGADSIVVSGGYEDDEDYGDEIIYTGAGANDPMTKKQIDDQSIDQPGNAGLVTSQLMALPVRVIRGSSGNPEYSPTTGYRYDGLYRVDDHWSEIGRSGFRIWRYRLTRLSPQEAAPYVPSVNLPPGNSSPGTTTGVVQRITRSTAVVEVIKKLYEHTCQVCDAQLEVPGGYYSEGAHIRALGKPHNGPDVPDNVLCLCPNDHALFDDGGIYITDDLKVHNYRDEWLGPLTLRARHVISRDYLRYHRGLWGKA